MSTVSEHPGDEAAKGASDAAPAQPSTAPAAKTPVPSLAARPMAAVSITCDMPCSSTIFFADLPLVSMLVITVLACLPLMAEDSTIHSSSATRSTDSEDSDSPRQLYQHRVQSVAGMPRYSV